MAIELCSLLHRSESETLNFKRDQYPFYGKAPDYAKISDEAKSEFLKDILAFANAWKDSDAHIVIGVAETDGRAGQIVGADPPLKDNNVQELVNAKTNRPVSFLVEVVQHEGVSLTLIQIKQAQSRRIFLTKDFGKLRKNVVYIRQGSSTSEMTPDEVCELGREEIKTVVEKQRPDICLEFEYCLETWRTGGPPFNLTGESGRAGTKRVSWSMPTDFKFQLSRSLTLPRRYRIFAGLRRNPCNFPNL